MAKTDPLAKPAMGRGNTQPMIGARPAADPAPPRRVTEPLIGPDGQIRDTVRNIGPPPGAIVEGPAPEVADPESLVDPSERVTLRRAPKPVVDPNARREAVEGLAPRVGLVGEVNAIKVDVSKVDPRKAPTRKIDRPVPLFAPRATLPSGVEPPASPMRTVVFVLALAFAAGVVATGVYHAVRALRPAPAGSPE